MAVSSILVAVIVLGVIIFLVKAKIVRGLVPVLLIVALVFGALYLLKGEIDLDGIFDKDDDDDDDDDRGDIKSGTYTCEVAGTVVDVFEVKGNKIIREEGDLKIVYTYKVRDDKITLTFKKIEGDVPDEVKDLYKDAEPFEYSYKEINGGFEIAGLTYKKK